jgi:catechol 2,3-dioxygenase-like lactoylglutathione lyase family enzyme
MDITGIESVVAGVADLAEARRFFEIYGLAETEAEANKARFEATDGSSVVLRQLDHSSLPPADQGVQLAIWGVAGEAELERVAAELGRDRPVTRDADGMVTSHDDDGHGIAFRVTKRRPFAARKVGLNVAGLPPGRINTRADFDDHGPACGMGHIVYWSPDPERSNRFYVERLGFRTTDRFEGNGGVFSRAVGHKEHHSIFFLGRPGQPPAFQHLEFGFPDVQDVIAGGHKLLKAGFVSRMGPGRHEAGSNWFWYFDSPLGGAVELSADIDIVDDDWVPKVWASMRDAAGWHTSFLPERSRP